MNKSLFNEYVAKYFAPLVSTTTERINGKKEEEQLLYKTMLTEEYSADLKWGSKEINTSIVSADIVSLESELPLKSRDSIGQATGDLPKLGMKLQKGEKLITDIQMMKARKASDAQIAAKIFDDVPKCLKGVEHAKEIMFLQGLSTGVALIPDEKTGKGVRVNYGYKSDNTVTADKAWGATGYTPITNINAVFSKVQDNAHSIAVVLLSQRDFNYIRTSAEGKELAANFAGMPIATNSKLPTPTRARMLEALADEYGCEFRIVNSSFRTEQNGVQTSFKPFAEGNLIFLYDNNVGRLVYGDVAEKSNPVAGVQYQQGSQGTLVSKYSKTDPLVEFTTVQALAVPVVDSVEMIYRLVTVAAE